MGCLRILIVDDDPDICELIEKSFRGKYDVMCVQTADQFSKVVNELEPDVFIIDVMLPDKSGFFLAEKIQHHPVFKFAPLIFLTAKGDKESMKKGYGYGAIDYEVKPIAIDRFVKNIDVIVQHNPPPVYEKKHQFSDVKERFKAKPVSTTSINRYSLPEKKRPPLIQKSPEKKSQVEIIKKTDGKKEIPSDFRIAVMTRHPEIRKYIEQSLANRYEFAYISPRMFDMNFLTICEPDLIIYAPVASEKIGLSVVAEIKRAKQYSATPFIFLDLKESIFHAQDVYSAGIDLYITTGLRQETFLKNIELFRQRVGREIHKKKFSLSQVRRSIEINTREEVLTQRKTVSAKFFSPPPIGQHAPEAQHTKSPIPPSSAHSSSAAIPTVESNPMPQGSHKEQEGAVEEKASFRIFIVDSDRKESMRFYDALYYEGYELVFLDDCVQALKGITEYDPDLVITELFLPKLNGIQFCEKLKQRPNLAKFPVILFTKKSAEKSRDRALRSGASIFLTKDVDVPHFAATVADILNFGLRTPTHKSVPFLALPPSIDARKLGEDKKRMQEMMHPKQPEENGEERKELWLD